MSTQAEPDTLAENRELLKEQMLIAVDRQLTVEERARKMYENLKRREEKVDTINPAISEHDSGA